MTKLKNVMFSLLSFFIATSYVGALGICDTTEQAKLNSLAANAKATYEIKKEVWEGADIADVYNDSDPEHKPQISRIYVSVLNLTDEFDVEISTDNKNNVKKYSHNEIKDGSISFVTYDQNQALRYTIKLISSDKTSCPGSEIRTFYVQVPRYNKYSADSRCVQVPDYYLCQEYVTFDEVDYDFFAKGIAKEIEKLNTDGSDNKNAENKTWFNKSIDYVKDNKVKFIVGGTLVVVIIATTIVIKKRRDEI